MSVDGQTIAVKLGNQIDRVVVTIKRNLALINNELPDNVITFDDAKDPLGDIYRVVAYPDRETDAPTVIKKKAIDLLCYKDRCSKELVLVKDEMFALASFYSKEINIMDLFISQEVLARQQAGLTCLAATKRLL